MTRLRTKYFVLKPEGSDVYARASRAAMRKYADFIEEDDPSLAEDLRAWVREEAIACIENGKESV